MIREAFCIYALLLRKKNFVISSATAGMSASPSTTPIHGHLGNAY